MALSPSRQLRTLLLGALLLGGGAPTSPISPSFGGVLLGPGGPAQEAVSNSHVHYVFGKSLIYMFPNCSLGIAKLKQITTPVFLPGKSPWTEEPDVLYSP